MGRILTGGDPEGKGASVVGVDLFFWFVYKFPEQAQRKAELEQAFAALSEWKVTLLVGDVPLLKSEGLKHRPRSLSSRSSTP